MCLQQKCASTVSVNLAPSFTVLTVIVASALCTHDLRSAAESRDMHGSRLLQFYLQDLVVASTRRLLLE